MKLDRFISNRTAHSRQAARLLIASGRVQVGGRVTHDPRHEVDQFVAISLDGQLLQAREAHFLMLHKPVGYLSATRDPQHPTVMELLPAALGEQLHIGGRLDRGSSGLLILTNDGLWSRRLTEPGIKLPKTYHVTTLRPISAETAERFAVGIYMTTEQLTTSPAQLQQLGPCEARLTIYEGRYHQIKRMFHAVGNQVAALHRESMGDIVLDQALLPGQYRALTAAEIASVDQPASASRS
ncbi:16S rRNA pseudouridine516 synthase [Halopseudomonas sabulinigri]|uniref:Pseudouridine synthase n=1 Tax=Halopseudomonas sabulinigri TaxID=472181 RepID=A0A1H1W214_9GAMM|nr:pseudouridine synthase [Halopseudomonas sabulinigri]SDS91144.1 16S rRNA pseudouridine516 synthase [Halopseudomonas sabulinigri]